jgi:hypothetical protein
MKKRGSSPLSALRSSLFGRIEETSDCRNYDGDGSLSLYSPKQRERKETNKKKEYKNGLV